MRRIALAAAFALAAATPALALTVSPAPNRDQASHLKSERSPRSVDLRDTFAADARPLMGLDFIGGYGRGYSRTQTFGFGNVTTTITTGQERFRPSLIEPRRYDGFNPELIGRRR